MRIAVGADHGGFRLKERVRRFLEEEGHRVEDFGTDSEASVDYPDFGRPVAEAVARGDFDRGVLICGTGIGMSITANKVPGVRAALCHEGFSARLARMHNDANILCMGGRVLGEELALDVVRVFLETSFEDGGRHARRVGKVAALEASARRVG
ncbi:MAG: ribose 5-phosphate isomerase B [Anaerolineae bacterium]